MKTILHQLLPWVGWLLTVASGSAACGFPNECVRPGATPFANNKNLRSVTYGGNCFVAVGDAGTVVRSCNNGWWEVQATTCTSKLNSITYGDGRFVAGGDGSSILVSTNGADWTCGNLGISNRITAITFGQNMFVAATESAGIFVSPDAEQWFWVFSRTNYGSACCLEGAFYGNNQFVVVGFNGTILVSSNGFQWYDRTQPVVASLYCGAFVDGAFIVGGVGNLGSPAGACSPDGVSWTPYHGQNCMSVAYGNGALLGAISGNILRITNCGTSSVFTTSDTLMGMAYGNGEFIAVGGNGSIIGSTDGVTWTKRTPTLCPFTEVGAAGIGLQVSVGNCGMIYSSEDGVRFTLRRDTNGALTDVAYGGGRFVTVGVAGGILTSVDATNWTETGSSTFSELWGVCYGGGRWVAVGSTSIVTSSNGLDWAVAMNSPPFSNYLKSIVYAVGRFVAVGWDGVIQTSEDGLVWTRQISGTTEDLENVQFTNGFFYASGMYAYPSSGYINLVSRDGLQWSNPKVHGPVLDMNRAVKSNTPCLFLAGVQYAKYRVERSTNLTAWSEWTRVTNNAGVSSIFFNMTPAPSGLFFRAAQQ